MSTTITKRTVSGVSVYGSYVFMGLLHLVSLRFYPGPFVPLTKILLMPLLILAVFRQITADERKTTTMKMLIGALLLSGLGDALLIGEGNGFFIGGLSSFLCAHLLYIGLFVQLKRSNPESTASKWIHQRTLPAILIPISVLYILYPGLGNMLIPVVIYMGIITLMWLFALSNFLQNRSTDSTGEGWGPSVLLSLGATLFVASDAVLAIEKFIAPFPGARLMVMGTYILAQLALARGFIGGSSAHIKSQN
jgi:uncharacterized membrane protein YhhN